MNEDLSPIHEQALDALLTEAHGQASPPDLSRDILAKLANLDTGSSHQTDAGHQVQSSHPASASDSGIQIASVPRSRQSKRRKSGRRILMLVAAIAAAIAIMFWVQGDDPADAPKISQDIQTEELENGSAPATAIAEQPIHTIDPDRLAPTPNMGPQGPTSPRGVPLVVKVKPDKLPANLIKPKLNGPKSNGSKLNGAKLNGPYANLPAIDQVAKSLSSDWAGYWKAMGIDPTARATNKETAARLSRVLGTQLSADALDSPDQLQSAIVGNDQTQQVALRWLDQITDGGSSRLKNPQRSALAKEIAANFGKGFDQQFAKLLSGKSEQTSSFYNAMSSGGHDAMVRRLASVSMNVDLRCTKCHDAKIERDGRQEAYWAFASLIRKGVKRSRDGAWSVLPAERFSDKSSFYELSDGRQRFVQPSVDSAWMASHRSDDDDVREWSGRLTGSPELARGLVNSLWRMVYGRPLTARVVDTMAAPHHQKLAAIEQQLSDDLVASDFDISRTLALVVASPVARRSVPESLRNENALTASDADIHAAMDLVNSFAAAMPEKTSLGVRQRVDIAMKSMGKSLGDLKDQETLANIASPGIQNGTQIGVQARKQGTTTNKPKTPAVTGYPYKANGLPVQWLASIDDYQSRVDHLGYLAGLTQLPDAIHEASDAIHKANNSEELALQRVWWLLKP